jgi:hypothetical protein
LTHKKCVLRILEKLTAKAHKAHKAKIGKKRMKKGKETKRSVVFSDTNLMKESQHQAPFFALCAFAVKFFLVIGNHALNCGSSLAFRARLLINLLNTNKKSLTRMN